MKPEVSWVDATNLVERLRKIKAPKDIEYLRTAAELSRAGVIALVEAIAPGMDPYHQTGTEEMAPLSRDLIEVRAS